MSATTIAAAASFEQAIAILAERIERIDAIHASDKEDAENLNLGLASILMGHEVDPDQARIDALNGADRRYNRAIDDVRALATFVDALFALPEGTTRRELDI